MFTNLKRNLASLTASTTFEKSRMNATYSGDQDKPKEEDLKVIVDAVAGRDKETKSSMAFSLLRAKIETSESKKYWNYIIKSLLVFDRLVDEKLHLEEISRLNVKDIANYKCEEQKYSDRKIDVLVKGYYNYVKEKAKLLDKGCPLLRMNNSDKKQYLKSKSIKQIITEVDKLKQLNQYINDVFYSGNKGHLKYKCNQYLFLVVLKTVINVYISEYMAFISIFEKFFDSDLQTAQIAFELFQEFLTKTEKFIEFSKDHQFIEGFQITINDFRNPTADQKLLLSMKSYIQTLQAQQKDEARKSGEPINMNDKRYSIHFEKAPTGDSHNFDLNVDDDDDDDIAAQREIQASSPDKMMTFSVQSSAEKDNQGRSSNNSVTITQQFRQSLNLGFKKAINFDKEERPSGISLENYQRKMTKTVSVADEILDPESSNPTQQEQEVVAIKSDSSEECEVNDDTDEHQFPTNDHLTPAFYRILSDDVDDIFLKHENQYSEKYDRPIDELYEKFLLRSNASKGRYFDFKTVGAVVTEIFDPLAAHEEIENIIDFEPQIFDVFKNMYSDGYFQKALNEF